MVWTSTSCLFLVYPVFFIINYLILNNHKSLKNTPTIVTNKTSNDINQQISSSLNKNDSEISNIKEIKLIDIIKDSFDLFSAKKINYNRTYQLHQLLRLLTIHLITVHQQ